MRGVAVLPTVGAPFPAISRERQASMLEGYDSRTILEATSTVLADVENERWEDIDARLDHQAQGALRRWRLNQQGSAIASADTLHALSVLAASTIAMAQSVDGRRSAQYAPILLSA